MRRPAAFTALLLTSLLPLAVAAAQGVDRLSQLSVSLWPEYDRSAVLVIYQAELPADVALPATVELPIPIGAGQPHAVAYRTQDGGLVNADYETRQQGPWTIVSLVSESDAIWLEYYQDLTIADSERSFTFLWPGGPMVDSLIYEVQEPVGSTDMQVQPAPTSTRTDNNGLVYHQGELGAVAADGTASVEVRYSKSSTSLTVDSVPPASPAQAPSSGQGQGLFAGLATGTLVAIGIGLIAVVVLVITGVVLYRDRRPKRSARPRRRGRSPKAEPPSAEAARFCPQCGKPIRADDRYCRHCGTQLPHR